MPEPSLFRMTKRRSSGAGVDRVDQREHNHHQRKADAETSLLIDSYLRTMDTERPSATATDINMDRRIIRVDIPPAHAGITAALRRAFSPAREESCEQDFSDLLRLLN